MRISSRMAVAAMAVLLGAPQGAAGAGDAQRREPGETTFYLRMLGQSHQTACDELAISTEDGPDGAECSFTLLKLLPPCPQDPACETSPTPKPWRSGTFERPILLDASRGVAGVIGISSWRTGACDSSSCTYAPPVGVGSYRLTVSLEATLTSGETALVGSSTVAYTPLPGESFVYEYEMPVDPALDGRFVDALTFLVELRGQGAMHGTIEMHDVNPRFVVPTLVCPDEPGANCAA